MSLSNPPTYSAIGSVILVQSYNSTTTQPMSVCSQCVATIRDIDQALHTEWHYKVGDLPW